MSTNTAPVNYKASFALLTVLFFMWGFITVMNDVLINTFGGIFDLKPTQRSLVQFAFFGAFFVISLIYFLVSSISGKDPINRIGYNNGMAYSLMICGVGCLCFYPAALMNSYNAFLGALFILASGVTCLQICANPYAAILGSQESASSRLNLAQGLNSLGTTLGPLIGVILIYKVFSTGEQTPDSVGKTYLIYGIAFLFLGLLVKLSKMPSFVNNEKMESGFAVFKNPHLVLGILAIFFYVGSEVSVGSWLVEFLKDKNVVGMSEEDASYYLSYFWGGLMIGRLMASFSLNKELSNGKKHLYMALVSIAVFAFIYLMTSIKIEKGEFQMQFLNFKEVYIYLIYLAINYGAFMIGKGNAARSLAVFCSINIVLLLTAMFSTGQVAFWSIIGTGLFFSIGWSNVFTLSIKDLGKYTSQGSALLVMAIVGGACLPWIQSGIIEKHTVQISFIIPVIGMIYLIFYGLYGHKLRKNTP